MHGFVLRRLLHAVPLVVMAAVLTFILIHIAPGEPIVALAGEDGDAGYYAMMRAKFGLDRPIGVRLLIYLGNLLQGDLGFSYRYNQPALNVILAHLPATLLLMLPALGCAILAGVALGTIAASRANSFTDMSINFIAIVGDTVPVFWLAQILILIFALYFDLAPVQGMTNVRTRFTGFAYGLDVLHHMALPVTALTIQYLAPIARITRSSMSETLGMPFIQAAHAKGFSRRRVLVRHALPNALLPVVTVVGGQVGFLVAGAVLTETVFAWPGLGRLLLSAMLNRDFAILNGMFLMIAISVIFVNLATDILYGYLDPRIGIE